MHYYLMSTSGGKAQEDLERIITISSVSGCLLAGRSVYRGEESLHQPLEASQGTQHNNTHGKSVPEAGESDVAINARDRLHGTLTSCKIWSAHWTISWSGIFGVRRFRERLIALTLSVGVQLADHDISRMTDDGAENTGNVTTQEAHTSLR